MTPGNVKQGLAALPALAAALQHIATGTATWPDGQTIGEDALSALVPLPAATPFGLIASLALELAFKASEFGLGKSGSSGEDPAGSAGQAAESARF